MPSDAKKARDAAKKAAAKQQKNQRGQKKVGNIFRELAKGNFV